ncbi:coiled-coil domain-containing protein 106-like, partial [Scomber scombrus]
SEEDYSDTVSASSSTASSSEDKKCKRVTNPDQAVSRYKKILRLFNRGRTMSAAFKCVGVDWNTVVVTAPIVELFIVAPSKYKELLKSHNSQVKLSEFATKCATSVQEVSGKLLPLKTMSAIML